VWLQTHHPQHPLLQTLIHGGYHAFADTELAQREAAGFPPFTHMALLRAEAKHAELPTVFLHAAKNIFHDTASPQAGMPPADSAAHAAADRQLQLDGPVPAPMPKRAGMYRAQLILSSSHRRDLHNQLDAALAHVYQLPEARKVRWSLDVDPMDLY